MDENAWEHQEELSEIEKMVRLQLEVLRTTPDLAAQLQAVHVQATSRDFCALCRRKREFITYVQTLVVIFDVRYQKHFGLGALSCAFRTPATRLMSLHNLPKAASDLVSWYYNEGLPAEQRTEIIEQPMWYSNDAMEVDGHE